eukprot:gene13124-13254_t
MTKPTPGLIVLTGVQVACSVLVAYFTSNRLISTPFGSRGPSLCYLSDHADDSGFCDYALVVSALSVAVAILAGFIRAAAALRLSLRPAWLSSFLQAAQPKLQYLAPGQLAGMATSVATLMAAMSTADAAAAKREGVKPRLGSLKPQEFAAVAQALARLGHQMDHEVLDGYWTLLEDQLLHLSDVDRVGLLSALGALQQKPRSQVLGAFLSDMIPRLPNLSRRQLCDSLQALAQLKLSKVDTQGVRSTTAAAAPAPAEFISALLKHLTPQLPGPQGATAVELNTVLQALASLGYNPEQPWLNAALAGSAEKLQQAVISPGGEQAVVAMLHALSQLSVQGPDDLLSVAVGQLQRAIDRLSARQISAAMAAMKKLQLDPDEKLMASYLNRAAAAAQAGQASVQDMAGVLQSLAEAAVLPSSAWLQQYITAVRPKLMEADADSLAAIAHATAVLSITGHGQSLEELSAVGAAAPSNLSNLDYMPNPGFVSDLTAVALTRLGSNYMDAQRILNSPNYKTPFALPALADCCWGILKLGAQPQQVLSMVNMLINKSYDRFSRLTVQQLAGVAWCVARCSTSSSNKGAAKVKLPSKWLNQFATAAAPDVAVLTAPQLSDLIWALGALDVASSWAELSDAAVADVAVAVAVLVPAGSCDEVVPEAWLQQLAGQVQQRLASMQPQLQCRCVWALATLRYMPGQEWLADYACKALSAANIAQLQPGDLTDGLWGLYTLEQLAGSSQLKLQEHDFADSTVANNPTSCSQAADNTSSLLSLDLMHKLSKKLDKRVSELHPGQVLRLLQLAEGARSVVPSFSLPAGVAGQLSQVLSSRASSVVESTGVIGLAWAAANLKLRLHTGAIDLICKKVYSQLPQLPAADFAKAFWASQRLGYWWLPPQLEEFDRQSKAKLSGMTAADVALLLEAFKGFNHAPSKEWLEGFAGMTSESLTNLAPDQVLQLAVQLADATVGLPANQVQWLRGWTESLNAQQLRGMTGKQLFSILQLLAATSGSTAATAAGSTLGSTPSRPSEQMLALLCWALADHVGSCSGEEVYCLVTALASWRYVPPNGTVLLDAAAARLAEKLPVLSQLQMAHALRSFAQLNFKVGEPLQSKLCDRLLQAAANSSSGITTNNNKGSDRSAATMQQAAESAEVLAAVLMALPDPRLALVEQLMQQLSELLLNVPPRTLLELGQGLAGAGLQLRRRLADNTPGGASSSTVGVRPELLVRFGNQYLAAAGRAMAQLALLDLAALCSTLQQLGLAADAAVAERAVQALQQQLAAASGSSLAVTPAAIQPSQVIDIVDYVTTSGFRPNKVLMASVEELLLGWLQAALDDSRQPYVLMTAVASDAGQGAAFQSAEQEQQDQLAPVLLPADLARLLLCLNNVASSLYMMRARPSGNWVTAVAIELDRRGAATDTPAARALAYVQQLKVAG